MYKKYALYLVFFLTGLSIPYIFSDSNVNNNPKSEILVKTDTIFISNNKIINKNEYLVYQYIEDSKKSPFLNMESMVFYQV